MNKRVSLDPTEAKNLESKTPNASVAHFTSAPSGITGLLIVSVDCSIFSSFLFKKLRYDCHAIANIPENMNRYCGMINQKLKAVTAGQSLRELTIDTGTVVLTRVMTPDGGSPVRTACMPKK